MSKEAIERTLLPALTAVIAIQARVRQPFDSHTVSDLNRRLAGMVSDSDNFPNAFVSSDERCHGRDRPIAHGCV